MTDRIGWDADGNLYLPERFAYIGVAMDRRDAADEIQRAFDDARRPRMTPPPVTYLDARRGREIKGEPA
jgi:hypothetical protein